MSMMDASAAVCQLQSFGQVPGLMLFAGWVKGLTQDPPCCLVATGAGFKVCN